MTVTVTESESDTSVKFPGAGSALSPLTILVLLPLIMLSRRIQGKIPVNNTDRGNRRNRE